MHSLPRCVRSFLCSIALSSFAKHSDKEHMEAHALLFARTKKGNVHMHYHRAAAAQLSLPPALPLFSCSIHQSIVTMKVSIAIAIVAVVVAAVASLATVEAKPALVRRQDDDPPNMCMTMMTTENEWRFH
ncbi:hypothetical protein SYNPS1DRAFT_30249 [Syncephalis pseudoplumigaleata]|uniref:Uncharacterized protein n=1 Tax=Syncephalis pseudoplumigaleata TaxID=1712513 RepID=A0A4P9YYA7_9FUNG|nr:hypothetical protein SYNPS1DRAFT_30249 [Syncephalis pseudoplumigaleata]|eukprot:RKP23980.1 hypothetical protein SYNPS1DRAFT_30249 [Syncephalis pseudoplumigaleata]